MNIEEIICCWMKKASLLNVKFKYIFYLECNMLTGKHYLFEVDDKWQIDGTYYSNYLRFINHATN